MLMPDVLALLVDPDLGAHSFTVKRRQGEWVAGRFVVSQTEEQTFSPVGIIQPAGSETLKFFPEGERREHYLMELVDWLLIAKGVRIEAHDLVPQVREGIEHKHPTFLDDFTIAYPLMNQKEADRIFAAGLPDDYDEFCRNRKITAQYGDYLSIRPNTERE